MLRVQMKSCEAAGMVWAVSVTESAGMQQAQAESQRWMGAIEGAFAADASKSTAAWRATDWPPGLLGTQMSIHGTRVDGTRRQVIAGVVVIGASVVQLVVIGDKVSPDDVSPFFEGIEAVAGPAARQSSRAEQEERGG